MAVTRSLPAYRHRPGKGSFRGWLRVIARNKLIDRGRQRAPAPDSPSLDRLAAPAIDADEIPGEYKELFRSALKLIQTDFEPATWQAFWLVRVEDRSPDNVAVELGLTMNAVFLAMGRVVRRLREEFKDFLDDAPPPAPK